MNKREGSLLIKLFAKLLKEILKKFILTQ